jgi:3-hydroxy-9,10-secoandrosta-1,3,5(10)-triene-9,17-dione monooxygenase reductase component
MTGVTGDELRRVLGHLPTGVTVITAFGPEGPIGMAANSVTSVSLDPPLILFCPAKTSQTWPGIREAEGFCINIMAGYHEELSRRFSHRGVDRFAEVRWREGRSAPWLDDAVAWIGCTLDEEHAAGDHTIVVAAVDELEATSEVDPLIFFRGAYGTFQAGMEVECAGAALEGAPVRRDAPP